MTYHFNTHRTSIANAWSWDSTYPTVRPAVMGWPRWKGASCTEYLSESGVSVSKVSVSGVNFHG